MLLAIRAFDNVIHIVICASLLTIHASRHNMSFSFKFLTRCGLDLVVVNAEYDMFCFGRVVMKTN